jgi:DNA polymerase III epsilon subunit-like protein
MIGCAMDWETTGLVLHPDTKIEKQPHGIEFAAVLFDDTGAILEEYEAIVDPGVEIEEVITKITGLTNEDLRGKPHVATILPDIARLFGKADVLIAHNLPFDMAITEMEFQRLKGFAGPDLVWPKHHLCTAQSWQEQWGKRPKLLELYEYVTGTPLAQTHRALDDVRALVEICIKTNALKDFEGL